MKILETSTRTDLFDEIAAKLLGVVASATAASPNEASLRHEL
jgi:hypothetical protein